MDLRFAEGKSNSALAAELHRATPRQAAKKMADNPLGRHIIEE